MLIVKKSRTCKSSEKWYISELKRATIFLRLRTFSIKLAPFLAQSSKKNSLASNRKLINNVE